MADQTSTVKLDGYRLPIEPEDDLAGRARGKSYWHWVYFLDGKRYGYFNSRKQALEARDKRNL